MSYLRDWLKRKDIGEQEARKMSGIDRAIFDLLLRGERTVPGIALIIGHNLGMKPNEVKNLGITPDASLRKDWNAFYTGNPWHLDDHWWNRVSTFNASAESELIYGAQKKPEEPHVMQKNHVVRKPIHKREDYYGQTTCRYCGETFAKKAREQVYCSKRCATKDRRRLR